MVTFGEVMGNVLKLDCGNGYSFVKNTSVKLLKY